MKRRNGIGRLNAFTLVEILLVVVIIGILAGLITTRLVGRADDARVARAKSDIQSELTMALELFEQDIGRFPTTEEGLQALVANPGVDGWKRPYINALKDDPWSAPYVYASTAPDAFTLSSSGPDKQPGTADDITITSGDTSGK